MQTTWLVEALTRLDRRLLAVCDTEERRARLLAGSGSTGWDGVRSLIRPHIGELVTEPDKQHEPLCRDEGPLHELAKTLGLSALEKEIVLIALATHVEPRYQAVYAVLQDNLDQPLPTERLLRSVLAPSGCAPEDVSAALGEGGVLRRTEILTTPVAPFAPLTRPFDLGEDVVGALHGQGRATVVGARTQRWLSGRGSEAAAAAFLVVFGAGDRSGFARGRVGADTELLEVELPRDVEVAKRAAQSAWRIGAACNAIPVVDASRLREDDISVVASHLDSLVSDFGGRMWMLAQDALPLTVPQIPVTPTTWLDRRRAWLALVEGRGGSLELDAAGRLAARHRFGEADIDRVLDVAEELDEDQLDAAATSMEFTNVERSNLTIPTRSFDDVVLRDTTRRALERLLFFVSHRDRVALERGLGSRHRVERGPLVLFSGKSGTGKTLAAEALAGALGRPLSTVDLARLVSKYIGETEQHIDQVLSQAEQANSVLFFDEADAIFANRTENAGSSSEQFANMLVGYLLQRIEVHDGLVILATNLRQAIDEAFLRRFQFRIEFPLPEAEERARIWDLLLPSGDGRANDVDLASIGRDHRLAGGDIRNAALKAVFLAEERREPVGQKDVEQAVAVEMLEMGRLSRRIVERATPDEVLETDRGELLRACVDAFHDELAEYLRVRFLKEIHVVHGSPTEDRLSGQQPAVSLALFRLAAGRTDDGLRAGFIVSAWSLRAEEESELLGVVHQALADLKLQPPGIGPVTVRMQESHDFDLLHRFWTSHDQPVRPSLVVDVDIPSAIR